jgi:hypothetical protein
VEEIKCRATLQFIFAIYYLGDPIKNEMGKVCSMDGIRETTTKFYLQNTAKSPRGRTRRKCGGNVEMDHK